MDDCVTEVEAEENPLNRLLVSFRGILSLPGNEVERELDKELSALRCRAEELRQRLQVNRLHFKAERTNWLESASWQALQEAEARGEQRRAAEELAAIVEIGTRRTSG